MTEPSVICENCRKTLRHDQRMCPLFPEMSPPAQFSGKPLAKWRECVCTIHTCYDASAAS